MAEITPKENSMGTQEMSKLILFTGIPLMISLFINSLYNFVDSMFVSQVSEKALTALSLAAPVQFLESALGLGNAVGLNAVISKALGRKDAGEARRAANRKRVSNAVRWPLLYGPLFYLPFFAVLEFASAWMLRIFEASGYMLEIGIPALRILALAWLVAIPALVISAGLQGLSMGMGSMILTMARQAVLPLVFAGIFSRFGNLNLLWAGFILAEFLGIPAAMWFLRKGYKRMGGGKFQ